LSALLPDIDIEPETPAGSGFVVIPTGDIKPNPFQPRQDFDEESLAELAASIRGKGVIQPLVVRKTIDGYELIAGERRLRACQLAGFPEVPARILEVADDTEMLELSLIENLQRNDLNPVELAEGYNSLHLRWNFTHEKIAQRVGKDRATVSNTIRLLDLPDPILQSLRNGEISAGHAKAILSLEGPARQSALWKRIVKDKLSVRQTEEIARTASSVESSLQSKPSQHISPVLYDFTDRIRRALGTKVKIVKKGKKGSIRIEFYSDEELERLVDMLSRVKD